LTLTEKAYSVENIIGKSLAILSFIFITLALWLIEINSPAAGYEISIYSALPWLTWFLLLAALGFGISIIVIEAFTGKSTLWLVGFFIILLVNFIILSLQFFRGYYIYALSDPIAHLEWARSLASTGYLLKDNYYPVTHILGAVLIEVFDIAPETVMKYLPLIFTMLYMLFTYLLASVVSPKKEHALLTAAASSALLFSYYHLSSYPHALALFTFPLLFYLYFKFLNTPSLPIKLPFIIILLLFPFFHPYTELVLISCFLIAEVAKLGLPKAKAYSSKLERISTNPALLSLITFYLWISYFTVLGSTARKLIQWTSGEISKVSRESELESVFNLSRSDFLKLLLKMYGHNLLFFVLSLLAFGIIIIYFLKRREEFCDLVILALIFITSSVVFMTVAMSLGTVTWGRLLGANIGLWAAPVPVGFVLYELFQRPKIPKLIGAGAVIVILVFASTLGIFSIYRSPWISQPNWQMTRMDFCGSDWYGTYKSTDLVGRPPFQVPEFDYAPMGWAGGYVYFKMPAHFGYPDHEHVGEVVEKDTYIVLTERFKQAADEPALKEWMNIPDSFAKPGFDENDFIRIMSDPSIDTLYTNSEFEILLVNRSSSAE
jgi:hypothetical protein